MTFFELIENARAYLAVFDYDNYPVCFQRFEGDAKPLFDGLGEENSRSLAAALVEELAQRQAALSWGAKRRLADEHKRVLSLFLTPAAQRHSKGALAFAEQVRTLWGERYPRNGYLLGTYEQIMKGFDANLLGLPLRKSKKR